MATTNDVVATTDNRWPRPTTDGHDQRLTATATTNDRRSRSTTATAMTNDLWPDHQPHSTTYHDHRPLTTNSMVCEVAAAAHGQQEQEQWLMVRR